MPIEKAFAIKAEPKAIWDALTAELAQAEPGAFDVERAVTNESLTVWVTLQAGVRAPITYRLIRREDHTEVVATMEPQGLRSAIFNILTLGRSKVNYELALAQGLANLKEAVEGSAET
jgi:hypothetical protein